MDINRDVEKIRLIICGGWDIDGIRITIVDNNCAIIYYDRYLANYPLQKKIIYLNPIEKYIKKITIEEKLEREYKKLKEKLETENKIFLKRTRFCNQLKTSGGK